MASKKSQLFHWRRDVRHWLGEVVQYQQQSGLDFHTAAFHSKQSFPSSELVEFAGKAITKGIAVWAVKDALREAAASIGLQLDDATVSFLADLAVDVILPAAA
jgi:hypothetical protein